MGTSTPPEQETPPEEQQETPPEETTSQETPQTPPPQDPPTESAEARYTRLLEEQLRAQNAQIQQLQAQREQAPPPPPLSPEAEKQRFYNDPMGAMREELQKTVAPLMEFVKGFKSDTEYDRIKNRLKADPRFAPMWDAQIEAFLDATSKNIDVNDNTVQAVLVQAIGLKAIGQLPGTSSTPPAGNGSTPPTSTSPTAPRQVVTPPHVRPTAPSSSSTPKPPKLRQLTELEKRLARENKMSDEEYLKWLDVPASGIGSSKIGKPEAPKT